ncbi:hypothetical protein IPL68_07785 [Candidatus Saccharibacteria bacterium]|nr:MAG: hypothetical protein IPL68_07785 [Candidatus Saccharibacteria bacterium]
MPLATSIVDDVDLRRVRNERNEQDCHRLRHNPRGNGAESRRTCRGVVIAPDDIVKFAPLEMAQKGVVATQYPMGPIEELGLLKMDFLGLSNLTIIKNALRIIKKSTVMT